MDPDCSEGALVKFVMDSGKLVYTLLTSERMYTEITPWNVIDFGYGEEDHFANSPLHEEEKRDDADDTLWYAVQLLGGELVCV